jgi:hypothetical protein
VHYSEYYMEYTSQQVDINITVWMNCISVNIIWKILHTWWTLLLQFQWSALRWILYGRYFTASEHWYCSSNEVHYSYVIWKILHSKRTLELQFQWSALQWIIYGSYFTAGELWYFSLIEVT